MAYTTIDDSSAYFQTKTYTGNGYQTSNTQSITLDGNSNLQPDWVWIKDRDTGGYNALLVDVIRGVTKYFRPNLTNAEDTYTDSVTSFNTDGFTLGRDHSNGECNRNNINYVSWNWKAGTSVSGNSSGSGSAKAYTGSVSTTAGFSIIRYLGNGTNGHTIPHHLGAAPRFIWMKRLDSSTGGDGTILHMGMSGGANDFIEINSTGAKQTNIARFRNTAPTSSVFTIASDATVNADDSPYIAYCFAEKKGYSKFGSYTGNGNANGTFVYTGFKPAWVMVKASSTTGNWTMFDNKRSPFNFVDNHLYANTNAAEQTASAGYIDFLSNGFKKTDTFNNADGETYIYMAFAENPFVTSTGIPATAR